MDTRYEVDGSTLTQVVEHHGHAYPVVSDPKSIGVCLLGLLPAVCVKCTRGGP